MSRPTANIAGVYLDLSATDAIDKDLYGGEGAVTPFSVDIEKSTWFATTTANLKGEGTSEDYSYKFSRAADFLLAHWLRWQTPNIAVNDATATKIAFCWNLGHNLLTKAVLMFSELPAIQVEPVSLDMLASHLVDPGKWESYNRMIGNVDDFVDFGSNLPPRAVNVPLIELVSTESQWSLPLCQMTLNDVRSSFVLQDQLQKLIRVQTSADAGVTWVHKKESAVDLSALTTVTHSKNNNFLMDLPQGFAEYAIVTKPEREVHQSESRLFLLNQVQKFTSGKQTNGSIAQCEFKFSNPVRVLYFNIRNLTAKDYNNHSNYTTNATDLEAGLDPLASASLYYENLAKFQDFTSDLLSEMQPFFHSTRVPNETGYHSLHYCNKSGTMEVDGSVNFSTLSTRLDVNVSEESTDPNAPAAQGNEYVIEIRSLGMQVMELKNNSIGFPSYS